jgi:RNA polymerase sigma-70 factor (ECF subfamily)
MDLPRFTVNELAQACAHSSDAAEWSEFLRRITPLASVVVWRVVRLWRNGQSNSLADDIVQEVLLKLCDQERRILREFEPRGEDSFLALLRMVAASVANDYLRALHSAKRGGATITTTLEPEQADCGAGMEAQEDGPPKTVLYSQLDERLRRAPEYVSERDRSLFWLYYRHGFTAEEIASIPSVGLSAKGVESALRRVSMWLRAEIEPRRVLKSASGARRAAPAFAKEKPPRGRYV